MSGAGRERGRVDDMLRLFETGIYCKVGLGRGAGRSETDGRAGGRTKRTV